MEKVAFVADCHIGNHKRFGGQSRAGINFRCEEALNVFEAAVTLAQENHCAGLIVAGDLFDSVKPEPQVIRAVQERIPKLADSKMLVALVLGNHECASALEGDNSLGPLQPLAIVFEAPHLLGVGGLEIGCVPYQTGSATLWLSNAVEQAFQGKRSSDRSRALVLHLGIADEHTPKFLQGSHDAVDVLLLEDLCRHWGVDLAVAGNWHERRVWERPDVTIIQVGALCPTGFDNPGLDGYGGLVTWDGGKPVIHEIRGPRFVKAHCRDVKAIRAARAYPGPTYLQVIAPSESITSQKTHLEAAVRTGELTSGEVVADSTEVEAAARTAAASAKSRETLFEALGAFVQEMPLPDGVDRNEVLQRTRQYLARVGDA